MQMQRRYEKVTFDNESNTDPTNSVLYAFLVKTGRWPQFPRQVDGKTGNLGDKVSISREKAKVHVTVEVLSEWATGCWLAVA